MTFRFIISSGDAEFQLTLITCQVTGELPANQMSRVVIPLSNFPSRTHPSRQILASRPSLDDQLTPWSSIEPLLSLRQTLGPPRTTSSSQTPSVHNGPRHHACATTARLELLEHQSYQHRWPRPAARLCDASRSSPRQLPNKQACAMDVG